MIFVESMGIRKVSFEIDFHDIIHVLDDWLLNVCLDHYDLYRLPNEPDQINFHSQPR
jgi:hypothetical protein